VRAGAFKTAAISIDRLQEVDQDRLGSLGGQLQDCLDEQHLLRKIGGAITGSSQLSGEFIA
jgi:hypothetical protein